MKQTFIYITDTFEFYHRYENAPDEVAYLRYLHRHLAHVKVKIEVFHDDRELEFIMVKHRVKDILTFLRFDDTTSCEMVAELLLSKLQLIYGDRDMTIEVNEDNENGVELIYRKEEVND